MSNGNLNRIEYRVGVQWNHDMQFQSEPEYFGIRN